ncbi:MAG: dTDP-4-dehydrorhamnose reductase [Pontixanthobacter sp.]
MKVLLFGANGQVGRALKASVREDMDLVSIGRSQCDLSDPDAIYKTVTNTAADLIINAAAFTAVDRAETDRDEACAINSDAVGAMVSAGSGKLVHISTDFVFDGTQARPYRPRDKRNPLSVYGSTKAQGEDHLRDDDLLIRTSWVYAAGGRNFVRTMLGLIRERDELRVVADQIGAPTWAGGLAETIWALVAADACGVFHHSDAGVASWYDFAVAIREEALAAGLLSNAAAVNPIATEDWPTPATRPAFSLLDCSTTREFLQDGFTHWRTNLRNMLTEEKNLG